MKLGEQARKSGDFARAEQFYAEATRLAPENADAWHMLGLVQGYQGRLDDSLVTLSDALVLEPTDTDIILSIARVKTWADRLTEADRHINDVLTAQPQRQDAWILRGRIAYFRMDYTQALTALDRAMELGPADVELLLCYGDIARAQGQEDRARAYYLKAQELDRTSADVRNRLEGIRPPQFPRWRMALSGGKSWLSRSRERDWNAATVSLERSFSPQFRAFAAIDHARRFGFNDTMLKAGVSGRGGLWEYAADAGVTPSDDVLPEFQAAATVAAFFGSGQGTFSATRIVLDAQHRRYPIATINTLSPGLDLAFSDDRWQISARWINTFEGNDNHLGGWLLRSLIQLTDRIAFQAGYGIAPEAERGVVSNVRNLSGAVLLDVTGNLRWRIDIVREARQGSYRRVELTSGVSIAF
jgi:YaiO family outer membrane protein